MAKRIRIFFINCPSLAVDAASFLILAQNRMQAAIQFEVHHFWIYGKRVRGKPKGVIDRVLAYNEDGFHSFAQWPWPLSKWLEPLSRWLERKNRTRLDLYGAPPFQRSFSLAESLNEASSAISSHDDWFEKCGYNRYDTQRDPVIVVTETALRGGFLGNCGREVALVSAANWEDFFRPASGLEYILNSIQRFSLRMLYGSKLGTHYPSRGCIWDFHVHQPDSTISSYLGFLCETCRNRLASETLPSDYAQLMSLIENEWVGSESDPSSVAGILRKHYRYSLSRSAGLHPGIFSAITESMKSEFGKFTIEVLKWSLIVLITLFFITYFPDLARKWRELTGPPDQPYPGQSKPEASPTESLRKRVPPSVVRVLGADPLNFTSGTHSRLFEQEVKLFP
jgi:hypothetical protein